METNKGIIDTSCALKYCSDIRSGDSVPTLVPIEKLLTSSINQINSASNIKEETFSTETFCEFFLVEVIVKHSLEQMSDGLCFICF